MLLDLGEFILEELGPEHRGELCFIDYLLVGGTYSGSWPESNAEIIKHDTY